MTSSFLRSASTWYAASSSSAVFGMLLVLASTLAFSSMALLVNMGRTYPSFQQVSIRFWVQALATAACQGVAVGRPHLFEWKTWLGSPANRRLLLTRSLWGACGMSSYYYALTSIRLSDATALTFTNVPLTAIFAHFLLKEAYTWLDGATALLSMVGVLLVAQPSFIFGGGAVEPVPWYAVLVCLFGAATSALAYVTIRSIGKSESSFVVVLFFAAVGSVVGPIAMAIAGQSFVVSLDPRDIASVLAMGFLGFIGQLLLNTGIQISPAGPASVMRYADVIFAIIFQSTLLGEAPGGIKIVGCLLIMSCVVAVYLRARAKEMRPAGTATLAASPATASNKGSAQEDAAASPDSSVFSIPVPHLVTPQESGAAHEKDSAGLLSNDACSVDAGALHVDVAATPAPR